MKLSEILKEAPYDNVSKHWDAGQEGFDRVLEDLKPYASILDQYITVNKMMYRGMNNTAPIIVGNGNEIQRKSANTENYYTLLLEVLPEWKAFPKRSQSFICSTSEHKAGVYSAYSNGEKATYVVIPLENQPIGVCTAGDFWDSFEAGFKQYKYPISNMKQFNNLLEECRDTANYITVDLRREFPELDIPEGKIAELSQTNPKTLLAQLDDIGDVFKFLLRNRKLTSLIDPMMIRIAHDIVNDGSFIDVIANILDPKKNGFKIVNPVTIPKGNHELWFSGKVLFVNEFLFAEYKRLNHASV